MVEQFVGAMLPRKIFLTGTPGVGKTTCIQAALADLTNNYSVPIAGFCTQERRDAFTNQRLGFDIVEYQQQVSPPIVVPLARVGKTKPTIGKYSVNVENIRRHMVRTLHIDTEDKTSCNSASLMVMDEVGKMELLCPDFFPAVWNHLNHPRNLPVLGTLPLRPLRPVDRILGRDDVMVLLVTQDNRNELARNLVSYLKTILSLEEQDEDHAWSRVRPYLFKRAKPGTQQPKK